MRRVPLIAAYGLITVGALVGAAGPAFAAMLKTISHIEIRNGTDIPEAEIRNLLPFREGDLFQEAEFQKALRTLEEWRRFSEVRGEKRLQTDGWHLTFHLREGILIGEVRISGNYPYLSRRLRRTIAIHPGDLYDASRARRQLERLEAFYGREGYFGTRAEVTTTLDPRVGTAIVQYHIHKGEQYRLGRIKVSGNTLFPKGRFVSALNPLLAYKPARLRRALDRLENDYRERGYLEARIRTASLKPDPERRRMDIVLEVREGDSIRLGFRGNSRIRTSTLKKEIPVLREGDVSLYGLKASSEAILALYRRRGFLGAHVEGQRRKIGEGEKEVIFHIVEGLQTRVKRIRIEGNRFVSDRRIKRILQTREQSLIEPGYFQPDTLENDGGRLSRQYEIWGLPGSMVSPPHLTWSRLRDRVTVTIPVQEGELKRIEAIEFVGNEAIHESKLRDLLALERGDPLDQERLTVEQRVLLSTYAEQGYPYAEIKADYSDRGVLTFQMTEGEQAVVGEVLIVGNQRTRRRAIEQALDLKRGRPFSYRKLLKSESSLRKTGSFHSVDIEPVGLKERESVIHLVVRLEENPTALVDLDSSFDTDDKFTGSVVLHQNNLFGFAKRANFRATGGQDIQKGEINFIDPRLFGLNLELALSGLFLAEQRPAFNAIDGGGKVSVLREFTPSVSLLTKYEFTRTFFRNVTDPTDLTQRDNTTSLVGSSVSYDTRDSFADPRRGWTLLAGLDLSTKIIASGFNFLRPFGSMAYFRSLGDRVTLLNYLRAEEIEVFGGDVLTRDKKLFLGGDYTVRGFAQDGVGPAAGGTILLLHSAELQTRIKGEFKFALFADSGSLTNSLSEINLVSLRHSAGAGLRYVTPIGPLRLDYGIKLDRVPGESFSRLHFAFGYAF